MVVCAKGLRKVLRGNVILDDVSINVEAGTVTGIVGPSGAGKSTLLRIIAGIDAADEGSLAISGFHYKFPCDPIRTNRPWPTVTLVFQGLCLWPHLTLRDNVMLPIGKEPGGPAVKCAIDFMARFGISELASRFPNQVSGGQRQLFALCRALALKPSVLLLDEVTAAIDVEHVRTLRQTITNLRDEGTAVILVSHSIPFVRRITDRVAFLDHGRLHEVGGVSILSSPTSPRLREFLIASDELTEDETA
ncbi:hypothetical protein A3A71_03305 [Candidatus Berkelbacteria bacterium RIFCSPLOWO2_01_FULL_50_28]|uniref:ABC transporter domain-containing protein n=1 Tax=Candidatus Berkelbacteria bacterium RIFCSPLOWO2_01_FULL_50_28 TaxID=1797471 RepID=A0A1F5ECE8_9BACT|nr:MAG: hypothetical protein A2807_02870 [Candidatus Berkelbacteria bacterium RIFCSPHIGHO2_01_FULL_50_36]OGD65088.1 MAG: hypothetical protein A3A71_03305 [Candidatus Berkelbacteria bacterium RIFCSPLOWO2_01_FULL_50_28]